MMKHALARYDAYKDSGVEWLGEVPSHWELKRLKDIASITRGAILRPVDEPKYFDENGHWYYLNISDVTKCKKYVYTARLRLSTLGSTKSARVKAGNLIITASATIGKPFINKVDVCIHDGFIPFKNVTTAIDYFYYFLKNKNIYASIGKTNTQKNIYLDEVKNVCIGIPCFKEQNTIAAYLDTKTAQLDCKIDLLTQKATQYGKLKQSLINETVTRGLDKTVVMKYSGVEWLGEVPAHWGISKLSQAFSQIGSGTTPKSGTDIYYEGGTTNWINTGDLNDNILHSCKKKVTDEALKEYSLTIYSAGSIIIAMYGATIGKVSVSMIDGCTNQACCVLNKSKVIHTKFLFYWFLSKRDFIISLSYGGGQPNISQDTIKSLRLILPLIEEQKAIADHLDNKTAHIDHIIETINTQIDKLKELRKTLINDVVTGKIKVV